MATKYWLGTAPAVAQIATATFGVYDVATTRKITINGLTISAVDSGSTLTAALTALAVLLNASTHPYFSYITWSSNATQIIGTADVAGTPFTFVGAVSGGTGTVTNAYTISTVSSGPNDWSTLANWSDGALPADTDTVIFKDSSISVAWGLALTSIEPTLLRIDKTYTGRIGLSRDFATTADGGSTVTTAAEYRAQYLTIGPTTLQIGQNFSASAASGSGRIKIDLGTDASTVVIYDTAAAPSEVGQTAVQLLANNNTTDIFVRSAPGGVGIAIGPGETTTIRTVSISDTSTASKVFCGPGTTLTTWSQNGGTNFISPAATVTTVTCNGGSLIIEGSSAITTVSCTGGTVISNTTGTITTATVNGTSAIFDFLQSNQARTVTTFNGTKGTLKVDLSVVTLTNKVTPPSVRATITVS